MIERLLTTLRLFADQQAGMATAEDFLDAYRLIVDCPQYELGATARSALDDMQAVAEGIAKERGFRRVEPGAAAAAARLALAALGESP